MTMISVTHTLTKWLLIPTLLPRYGCLLFVVTCLLASTKVIACPTEHTSTNQALAAITKQDSSTNKTLIGTAPCKRTASMPKALRLKHYRAPTPDCSPNAITLSTEDLQTLIAQASDKQKPLLIDVLSVLRRPAADGFAGEWLPNEERLSLPHAVWLPNVGYGTLNSTLDTWFKQSLHDLTQGNVHHPLVFFCIADCWMSWNAVSRAQTYGYDNLYWYKNGTDGWQEHELPLTPLTPSPLVIERTNNNDINTYKNTANRRFIFSIIAASMG